MTAPRRPSLVGPTLLIGVGVLVLMQNLGFLPFGFWWTLWRFWPVVLIVVGLDLLLGRRSPVGGLVVLGLTVALIAGVLF